jgi:hypothetical protein
MRGDAILVRTHESATLLRTERGFMDRENRESMEDIHLRILRVTDDLGVIQRELNCAAMQAPTDPELMEALAELHPRLNRSRCSSPPSTRCATFSGSTCRS